jgi:deoxyribodipyrimidine photolyase
MSVAISLFTRDLRVHDNPVLHAACHAATEVVPLSVLDPGILRGGSMSANRAAFLADALADLDAQLRKLGGRLVVRSGDVVDEVARMIAEWGAAEVHVAADVSGYSHRRERLPRGGETVGRRILHDWLAGPVSAYQQARDDLAANGTSRLSPYLHFGCVSATEALHGAAANTPGGEAFIRQLAWRDFHHQVLAARPNVATADYRSRHDRWRHDEKAAQAWRDGRTGYPIVDAGMRQLRAEDWMHNRARLITASFLTKTLYLDWRLGAEHFFNLLVDADLANNQLNWQWVAGTGTETRPNRALNPLRQAQRYDSHGEYVRRYLPELRDVSGPGVHRPWKLDASHRACLDYPKQIIDLHGRSSTYMKGRIASTPSGETIEGTL